MLNHINIRNYAIIEHWDVELKQGLTVVTGESGAGKSILIDAIELGLGGRADSSVVRAGCDRAEIVLTLDLQDNSDALVWLSDREYQTDNECVIRRVIQMSGPSRISINGSPCTVNEVKELAALLFNIHGQHQNQSLMQKNYQLNILDHFAGHQQLNDQIISIVKEWQKTNAVLQSLTNNSDNFEAKISLLAYQVNELDELGLTENEYEQLGEEHKKLANADQLLMTSSQVLHSLSNDESEGVINLLNAMHVNLLRLNSSDKAIINTAELIGGALIQLEEAQREMLDYVEDFQADPERLSQIEERFSMYHDFARKHKVEPTDLHAKYIELSEELHSLQNAGTDIAELEKKLAALEESFFSAGKKLGDSRRKSAKQLSALITEKIQILGMQGGHFDIQFYANKDQLPHLHGSETIEFFVCANPGQPSGSLSKIASGGEISRIALAIQVIASQKMHTPTLIFDEVDVGIGGNTAAVVGNILRELGTHAQVVCITHQPQVAVCGHQHLHVQKSTDKNSTSTTIRVLDVEQKTLEVARMLGGMTITEKTLANAKELMGSV